MTGPTEPHPERAWEFGQALDPEHAQGGEPAQPEPDPAAGPVPATGHPAVDASLRELAVVAGAGPAEQLPAFQAAHRTLRETLASIDEAASPG